jgi:DinB superfamily
MRKLTWLLALAGLWVPSLFGQDKNPVATAIREAEQGRSKNMVAAAEEMPADKYGFKATPDQMTFGHLTLHISEANYVFCSKIGGVAAPELSKLAETDPKDKLVERMKSSFDFCGTVLAKLDDSNLSETLTLFGERKASRAAAILMLGGSWADHYSLESTYLRLNGHLPPTAKK